MNRQPKKAAEKLAVLKRRRDVAEYLRKGISSRRYIASKLHCSYVTIHRDIQAITKKWRQDTADLAAEAFCVQLASIQWRRTELIEQWERSKEDAVTVVDDGLKPTTTRKGQTAAAAYMAELRALDEREDALLGLSKKDRAEEPGGDDWRRVPPEQLMQRFRERLAAMMPKNQENGE